MNEYTEGHVQQLLAEDPRIAPLITALGGRSIVGERREAHRIRGESRS